MHETEVDWLGTKVFVVLERKVGFSPDEMMRRTSFQANDGSSPDDSPYEKLAEEHHQFRFGLRMIVRGACCATFPIPTRLVGGLWGSAPKT